MRYIFLNLKRFDLPPAYGGVNRLAPFEKWGGAVVSAIQQGITGYPDAAFAAFFPEMHLLTAAVAREEGSRLEIGSQGVSGTDLSPGGNFGALTTSLPAAAAAAAGCSWTIIGHCEERNKLAAVLGAAGVDNPDAVGKVLGQEVKAAVNRGLKVLYCVGETEAQQPVWQETIRRQLDFGLREAGDGELVIGYEPVWSIGPGKTPAGRDYIQKIARFIKEETGGKPVVYGGGLKADNASMLRTIPEIDGGLIALTRFTGEIGFYPEEYLEIVRLYLRGE